MTADSFLAVWKCSCFGIENRMWSDRNEAVLEAQAFEGSYGVRLGPYIEALRASAPPVRRMLDSLPAPALPAGARGAEWLAPSVGILTDEVRLFDIDLHSDLTGVSGYRTTAVLRANRAGLLNAVVVFFRARLDETIHLSTSPLAPKTHWGAWIWDLRTPVAAIPGDEVRIRASVVTGNGQDRIYIEQADR